jgi:cytosine/adenosine deaminase-related metal-dependent hydrolase
VAVLAWRDDLGRIEPGVKADLVLIKNDASSVSFPLLKPYGQVVLFQAQRGDVHTVIVDGKGVRPPPVLRPRWRRGTERTSQPGWRGRRIGRS